MTSEPTGYEALTKRSLSAADDLDNMPKNYDARALRFDHAAYCLRENVGAIRNLLALVREARGGMEADHREESSDRPK